MANSVLIPSALRRFTGAHDTVDVEAATVGEALTRLVEQHTGLRQHLFDEHGRLRSFVNVYVNDEDIRHLQRDATPLAAGDIVSIVPSIAGGAPRPDVYAIDGLSPDEIRRYSRHLIMPEVAVAGQLKLKAARVLMIGTGGLGAPAGLYLTAAGVGTLGLVDFDVVDETNLQRQVTFGTRDVGRPKLSAARDRLHDLNPNVNFELHDARLTSDNALEIIRNYDIVVDGTDNFPTRYLVNDACVLLQKPYVYGSIFRFEGQITVFAAPGGPCYRCLYPSPPPPGLVPSCAEGGVLGVLPGIVGSIQASETIKWILGAGDPLVGRLVLFDALKMRFRELKLRRSDECPVCGPARSIHELIDYEAFCGIRGEEVQDHMGIPAIGPKELKRRLDAGEDVVVVDVREPHEVQICTIGGTLIPLGELAARVHELDSARDMVIYCRTGVRSAQAVRFLQDAGFDRVWNLTGGIHAWSDEVDPSLPKY
ncbi:MAG TPA: molybdopterin-synthase adenylyltransferase MoeB [Candidatus Krumholzibacteria bacterium]|nr:molybdopterin-synthase adenylyltransferase MoeB [Candidatus Krumholzibacteria bacterium]